MADSDQFTTTVSTRGQVVLPHEIRRSLGWQAGTRLSVEKTPDGVLLKPIPAFAETRARDVFGCLSFVGTPKSPADMDAGVLKEARRRHAGD